MYLLLSPVPQGDCGKLVHDVTTRNSVGALRHAVPGPGGNEPPVDAPGGDAGAGGCGLHEPGPVGPEMLQFQTSNKQTNKGNSQGNIIPLQSPN